MSTTEIPTESTEAPLRPSGRRKPIIGGGIAAVLALGTIVGITATASSSANADAAICAEVDRTADTLLTAQSLALETGLTAAKTMDSDDLEKSSDASRAAGEMARP